MFDAKDRIVNFGFEAHTYLGVITDFCDAVASKSSIYNMSLSTLSHSLKDFLKAIDESDNKNM